MPAGSKRWRKLLTFEKPEMQCYESRSRDRFFFISFFLCSLFIIQSLYVHFSYGSLFILLFLICSFFYTVRFFMQLTFYNSKFLVSKNLATLFLKQMTQPNLPIISITPIMKYETHVAHYLIHAAHYLTQ